MIELIGLLISVYIFAKLYIILINIKTKDFVLSSISMIGCVIALITAIVSFIKLTTV